MIPSSNELVVCKNKGMKIMGKVRVKMRQIGFFFDWTDDIHFVGYQLDHLYSCWPWRLLGEIVGVSESTARKYYNQDWIIEDDDQRAFVEKALEELDFSTREIKFLTVQEQRCFVKGRTCQCYFEDFPKDTGIEERSIQKVFPMMANGTVNWPTQPGIYLMCQMGCPANQPDRKFYLIKVGKSTNLRNRIQSYNGMNPLVHCLDVKTVLTGEAASNLETNMHNRLSKKYVRWGNTEWFVVPEEDYFQILAKGIKAL